MDDIEETLSEAYNQEGADRPPRKPVCIFNTLIVKLVKQIPSDRELYRRLARCLIRHWFGTMEYHKRPDLDYVRRLLGHKRLSSTQIYINMEKLVFGEGSKDYVVKACATIEEFQSLLAVGFDNVTD